MRKIPDFLIILGYLALKILLQRIDIIFLYLLITGIETIVLNIHCAIIIIRILKQCLCIMI